MSDPRLDEPYASAADYRADLIREQAEYAPDPRDAYPDQSELDEMAEEHHAEERARAANERRLRAQSW